jgi:hypothetical protein
MRKLATTVILLLTLPYFFLPLTTYSNELDADKKYLVQTDKTSCSPLAMVNAVKSLNYKLDELAWFHYLRKEMKVVENGGSKWPEMIRGLQLITHKTNLKFEVRKFYSIEQLEKVGKDRVIIFNGYFKKDGKVKGHTFIINFFDANSGMYRVVNFFTNTKDHVRFVKQKDFDFYLRLKEVPPIFIVLYRAK